VSVIMMLCFSTLLSLFIGELLLRTFFSGLVEIQDRHPHAKKFFQFDPNLGWSNVPNLQGMHNCKDFSYQVSNNSHGMRFREISIDKPKGIKRITVIGDSFVWGMGVPDRERFTEVLERQLNAKAEVLNFGVSGYGPLQYYLSIDRILMFQPDLVIVVFCLGNDFADNVLWERYGYYKPYATIDSDHKLRIEGYPLHNVKNMVNAPAFSFGKFIQQKLYLYRLFQIAVAKANKKSTVSLKQGGLTSFRDDQYDIYLGDVLSVTVKQAVSINEAILNAIKSRLKENKVALAVVSAPTKCEYGGCFPNNRNPNFRARDILATSLQKLKIPFIDVTSMLNLEDFYEHDYHWKVTGHQKVAYALKEWIEVNGINPDKQEITTGCSLLFMESIYF